MRALVSAVLVAGVLVTASARAHDGPHEVVVRNFEYAPARIDIDRGETVTWVAQDAEHTVTADDGSFDLPGGRTLRVAERAERRFDRSGEFTYRCRVHGSMRGRVVVDPEILIDDVTVAEGDVEGSATVQVRLARAPTAPASVTYETRDGTARAGSDYVARAGVMELRNDASDVIEIPVFGDADPEGNETFDIVLTASEGAAITADGARITVTLRDDDGGAERVTPSEAFPTLQSALVGAMPGARITVLPGLPPLNEPAVVDSEGLTITGTTDARIESGPSRGTALLVSAPGVSIEGVRIGTAKDPFAVGIDVRGVQGFTASRLSIVSGRYGIRTVGATRVVIEDVSVTAAGVAGVSIQSCSTCDTDVRRITASLNAAGVEMLDAGSVVVRDSVLERNRNGIVARATGLSAGGSHIVGNRIEHAGDLAVPRPPLSQEVEPASLVSGAAVWLDGRSFDVVQHNVVLGGRFGVAVTGGASTSSSVRILANTFTEVARWELGWDGRGANVCFAGNMVEAGVLRSEPPRAQDLYSCSLPATIGIPYPAVMIALLTDDRTRGR